MKKLPRVCGGWVGRLHGPAVWECIRVYGKRAPVMYNLPALWDLEVCDLCAGKLKDDYAFEIVLL